MYRLFKPLSSILKWGLYNHWMNGRQIISLFSGVWSGWLNKNSQPSEVGAQKWKLQSRHRRAHKATAQDLLSALPQQQQEEYSGEPRGQKTNQTPYLRSYSSGLKDSDERCRTALLLLRKIIREIPGLECHSCKCNVSGTNMHVK